MFRTGIYFCLLLGMTLFAACESAENVEHKFRRKNSSKGHGPNTSKSHAKKIRLKDTIIDDFSVSLSASTDFVYVHIENRDTLIHRLDSGLFYFFKFSFRQGKKEICFPYTSMTESNYPFSNEHTEENHWQSAYFPAVNKVRWNAKVPLSYFSQLRPGEHALDFHLRVSTEENTQKSKNIATPEDNDVKIHHSKYTMKIRLMIPQFYLRKIVVGATEFANRRDYDEGLHGTPDVYFTLSQDEQNYYRSGAAEQSIYPLFSDTIFYIFEQPPRPGIVTFYDEDVVFDDPLGSFYLNTFNRDTLVKLTGSKLLQKTEYWVSRDNKLN